ncbi:hypothetical protein SAMN02746098_00930 [Desulfosporosinus lacus DSM 15449]|uniref:Uncharacterized protein n=1 Tax=Desulfosporosinus lacus DSM 15449 TaxID=1121420 RepID=A0A1M5UF88_9FIRM|nr:hypothetical protein SAMN02746098_00930 [Desulfosporosinus lacus DSM 15449]
MVGARGRDEGLEREGVMLLRSPKAPSRPCMISRRERQTSRLFCMLTRAVLAPRNRSMVTRLCLMGLLRNITPSGLGVDGGRGWESLVLIHSQGTVAPRA